MAKEKSIKQPGSQALNKKSSNSERKFATKWLYDL